MPERIEPVKGTRDFYPELMQRENYIFSTWKAVCLKYGYEEFDGPLLEPAKLWQLKSGAEIPEQMYTLTDKSNRLLAIRPELTPTLARMIAEKQKTMNKPIKWFSIPRCWRYEQPQSGRLREFFQLNVDCIGSDEMYSDAEVIAIAIDIVLALKLTEKDFYVRISNRTLLNQILKDLGVADAKDVFRLIDKKGKLDEKEFDSELARIGGKNYDIIDEFLSIESVEDLEKFIAANKLTNNDVLIKAKNELKQLFRYLSDYGFSDYIKFDPTITRGFDYYTRTVFEVYDKSLNYRAIAGGGRYDNLVADFGGEPLSGIGFGMGDVVLSLMLQDKGLLPDYKKEYDYYVTIIPDDDSEITSNLREYAIHVAQKLRSENKAVFLELNVKKLNKALELANKYAIPNVVIIGKTELDNGEFVVKDMLNKKEEKIKFR